MIRKHYIGGTCQCRDISPAVERIAKAIYDVDPELQMWDGDPYMFHQPGSGWKRHVAVEQAYAVFCVLKVEDVT